MTNENNNVFSSSIIRTRKRSTNYYDDILTVEPATPVLYKTVSSKSCAYEPKNDKVYIPKKKTGSKVKTVRDIRLSFEKDIYGYLENELEMKKNFLLRKIRLGHSRNVKLRESSKKLLKSDAPLTKSIWRMLLNINPEEKSFPTQFVLWNGKNIQLNGSKGGDHKFISRYDISKRIDTRLNFRNIYKNSNINKKTTLLQNSLHVKFKPGPLKKKKYLDNSYQKHNFGETELVCLPKPGLEVQPTYGKPIPPGIAAFLHHSFEENSNTISKNLAEFAVSVLGKNVKGTVVQRKESCDITYDLSYRCDQNRLLMRYDGEKVCCDRSSLDDINLNQSLQLEDSIENVIREVMNDMLVTVDISLEQDNMYTGEDDVRDSVVDPERNNTNIQCKDKMKKRYGELGRLDVTVIRLSETHDHKNKTCSNTYCNLGCICDSLSSIYNVKEHCGRIECMFQCICDFSGYQISDLLEHNNCSNYLSHIINKDKKSNLKLAKEEKKFHQTVIVTEEKSIVLKSRKRDWKTSKKYASFYSQMRLKTGNCIDKELYVVVNKLDCRNIEPLCLVHNLYRCFCKGKFVDTTIVPKEEQSETKEHPSKPLSNLSNDLMVKNGSSVNVSSHNVRTLQNRPERTVKSTRVKAGMDSPISISNELPESLSELSICARVVGYTGRMFTDGYYSAMNKKIKEMEINDKTLQKKLNSIIGVDHNNSTDDSVISLKNIIPNVENTTSVSNILVDQPKNIFKPLDCKRFTNQSKLITWLESSYKQYKFKTDQGIVKSCLGPPQVGKLALYPWDFILSRYRERKNYFLVTKNKPFRIFMTVNEKKVFFESSININNIPWAEIDKYPITVKNLLTDATDLPDNFCILYGLSHSWELIGSVTKVNENVTSSQVQILDAGHKDVYNEVLYVDNVHKKKMDDNSAPLQQSDIINTAVNSESSKWFVMTVEDDFSEIQFYRKGFFVKYDSVIKAINVARVSKKTVRLSSQKCNSLQNDPQFGIYAIPSENDYCVFIGPYEKNEKLGIETVNTITDNKKKRTRGVWITTKKVDNLKVIDNPLSFMPTKSNGDNLIPLHLQIPSSPIKCSDASHPDQHNQNVIKTIKPIKICKTNGFYHLAANGMFQQIPQASPEKVVSIVQTKRAIFNNANDQPRRTPLYDFLASEINQNKPERLNSKTTHNKPIAEIAPQVKTDIQMPAKRKIEGMFILKPEEINKRSFEGKIQTDSFVNDELSNINNTSDDDASEDTGIMMDIENFLTTSLIQTAPQNDDDDIYVISDDEEHNSERKPSCDWRFQFIICKNIENLGWICGRRNSQNHLSFEFPGFKATDFYSENEAFEKINQVFSRKVYVPKHITLEWRTSDNPEDIIGKPKLHKNELTTDFIMTKNGLSHKSQILNTINSKKIKNETLEIRSLLKDSSEKDFQKKKDDLLLELEETSADLETESFVLWNEALSNKANLSESLGDMSNDVRQELSNILSDIISVSESSEHNSP